MYDVAVVVVRWYGGVKLGTGGLSRAYRETAAETLRSASLVDRYVYNASDRVPFDQLGVVYRLSTLRTSSLRRSISARRNEFEFDVRLVRAEEFAKVLAERRLITLP